MSTSAYYAYLNHAPSKREREDEELKADIILFHQRSRKTYGKRRIQEDLRAEGKRHGLLRIAKIMRLTGLKAKATKKYKVITISDHNLVKYENKLDRNFSPEKPNTHFTSDITYIRTLSGWLFLAVVIDLFSRKVVGWAMANHMRTELVCSNIDGKIQRLRLEWRYTSPRPRRAILLRCISRFTCRE